MKQVTLLLISLLTAAGMHATPLTPEAALDRAIGAAPMKIGGSTAKFELVQTQFDNGREALYIFGRIGGHGFVVTPADDVAPALLGYGGGNFTDENGKIAPAMEYWLSQLGRQISYASENDRPLRIRPARPERAAIEPLCATRWNQSWPFNNLCPELYGDRSVTGCVATAMAQVMKYHDWPERGEGSVAYRWTDQTLTADFSEMTFDWDNMLDNYNTEQSDAAQQQAVAELMKACGYSVNMSYSPQASGASSMMIGTAFGANFKYDKSLRYLSRDNYNLYDWENIIYESLRNDGPVIYDGQSYDGGHSFVCDGYQGNGYFHFNWGWGGVSDGYFLLDSLDPLEQGIGGAAAGFNFMQDIIVGIRPDRTGTSEWEGSFVSDGSFQLVYNAADNTIDEYTLVYNPGPGPAAPGELGYRFQPVGSDGRPAGEATDYTFEYEETVEKFYGFRGMEFGLEDIPDGNYIVSMIYRIGQKGEYLPILSALYETNSYLLCKNGTDVQLTPRTPTLPKVEILESPEKIYKEGDINVKARITNENDGAYFNFITAMMLRRNDNERMASGKSMVFDLEEGETLDLNYSTPFETYHRTNRGIYNLVLAVEDGQGGYAAVTEPVEVAYFDQPAAVELTPADTLTESREYYTADGVKIAESAAGEPQPALPSGTYIVKTANNVTKIIIR